MKPNTLNVDVVIESVLDSFFLLEPEWQIPAFIACVGCIYGVIYFVCDSFIKYDDRIARQRFIAELEEENFKRNREGKPPLDIEKITSRVHMG